MKFKQIEAFRVVMLTRSMTLAASELHTSQPNISRFITQLEAETGMKLFERKAGGLSPTPEAEAFYQEVQRSFIGLDTLEESVRLIRRLGTGTLRVAASPSIAMSVMPQVIRAFRQRYPEAPVSIQTSDSPAVAKWTATRYCDIGLASYLADTPGVQARHWATDEGVCIVPLGHRLARKRRIVAGDLDDEPFVSLSPGDGTRAAIDGAFEPDRRRLTLDTPYAATICRMVAMGLGVSVVNPLVVRHLNIPGIKAIAFRPQVPFPRYILLSQQHVESALMAAFLECLAEV
ncbi:LysR family transcriptional regulator [Paracidovorax avenae]|uniref:LysR family transcriptional regulator n=1 Tax=Paracidovorax avenae TaxID=80867 RepID=UPI000D208A55|nr:LysR family transcriptional regulator [Paracidovorax avenae]AVS68108.1 LysR family transcriptional regulator [Paracidovorax avenae]